MNSLALHPTAARANLVFYRRPGDCKFVRAVRGALERFAQVPITSITSKADEGSLPWASPALHSFSHLTSLELGLYMPRLDLGALRGLRHLAIKQTDRRLAALPSLPALTSLDIRGAYGPDLEVLAQLTGLRRLYADDLDTSLAAHVHLTLLWLDGEIADTGLPMLPPNLAKLDLNPASDAYSLCHLDSAALGRMSSLTYLQASVRHFPIGGLPFPTTLTDMHLYFSNPVAAEPVRMLSCSHAAHLTRLFVELGPKCTLLNVEHLTQLRNLCIHHQREYALPPELSGLTQLTSFEFMTAGNPSTSALEFVSSLHQLRRLCIFPTKALLPDTLSKLRNLTALSLRVKSCAWGWVDDEPTLPTFFEAMRFLPQLQRLYFASNCVLPPIDMLASLPLLSHVSLAILVPRNPVDGDVARLIFDRFRPLPHLTSLELRCSLSCLFTDPEPAGLSLRAVPPLPRLRTLKTSNLCTHFEHWLRAGCNVQFRDALDDCVDDP